MGKFSGYIVSIKPSSVIVGNALMVQVKYHVETSAVFEKINGWTSLVSVSSGDLATQKNMSPMHFGGIYDGVATFNFGVMPPYDELFTVELRGYDAGFSGYSEVVDVMTRYVTASASPHPGLPVPDPTLPSPGVPIQPPPGMPPHPDLPKPGIPPYPDLPSWLLPVGVGLVAVVLLMPSGKR